MIELKPSSSFGGDSTAAYTVSFDKEYTVQEFINEVLKFNEWGYIVASEYDRKNDFKRISQCEYKLDQLIVAMRLDVLNKKIIKATASGGYSRMDYLLHVEP